MRRSATKPGARKRQGRGVWPWPWPWPAARPSGSLCPVRGPHSAGPCEAGALWGGRGIYRPRPRGPLSPPLSARAQTRGSPSPGVRRPLGDREPETMAHDARKLSLLPRERGVRERPDVRGAQPGRPASGFTGINEKCFPSIQVRMGTGWAKAEPGTTRGALGSGAHGMPGGHVRAVPTSPGRGRRVISATSLRGPFPRRRLRGDLLSRTHPLACLLHQECPREQHPAGKWRAGLAGKFGSGGCYGM